MYETAHNSQIRKKLSSGIAERLERSFIGPDQAEFEQLKVWLSCRIQSQLPQDFNIVPQYHFYGSNYNNSPNTASLRAHGYPGNLEADVR
jgi:hypothetical protein